MKRRISRGKTKRVMPQASARLSSSQIVQLLILTFITNQPTRLCPVHARLDCHAPPFDALFQPQPARPRYDNHRRVYLEVLLSTLTSSVPPMGNIFTKFLLPLHSHRHARPSTPCRNTLTRAPSPPYPASDVSEWPKTLCFLWFWCHSFFLTPYLCSLVSLRVINRPLSSDSI